MHQIAFPSEQSADISAFVTRLSDMVSAIDLCIRVSGRDPKNFYIDLEIDKGHWSRIMAGALSFPSDKLDALMDIAGNDIPLQWMAWRRGKGMHLLESEQQRMLRERDERIRELEMEKRVLVEAIRGKA